MPPMQIVVASRHARDRLLRFSCLKVRDRENWGENQPEPLREIPPMQIVVDSRAVKGQILDTLTCV